LPERPVTYLQGTPAQVAMWLDRRLQEADKVLVIARRRGSDSKELEPMLRKTGLPVRCFDGQSHIAYLLDNRDSYHWGSPAPVGLPAAAGPNVWAENFENPQSLAPVSGSDLQRFYQAGYPFFEDGKFYFVDSLRPVFHGDLNQQNRSNLVLKLNSRNKAEPTLSGNYSARVRTGEYFAFNMMELEADKRYRLQVDFMGELGSRLIFQALYVDTSGNFKSQSLGSFKILQKDVIRYGAFDFDTQKIAAKNGKFTLQLSVSGDLLFDNLIVRYLQ